MLLVVSFLGPLKSIHSFNPGSVYWKSNRSGEASGMVYFSNYSFYHKYTSFQDVFACKFLGQIKWGVIITWGI